MGASVRGQYHALNAVKFQTTRGRQGICTCGAVEIYLDGIKLKWVVSARTRIAYIPNSKEIIVHSGIVHCISDRTRARIVQYTGIVHIVVDISRSTLKDVHPNDLFTETVVTDDYLWQISQRFQPAIRQHPWLN